jgi:DnaJ-class molecular chaperone
MNRTMCSSCRGDGKCEFCNGRGVVNKPQVNGQITMYETLPCAVCFGSGRCVSCSPDAALQLTVRATGVGA